MRINLNTLALLVLIPACNSVPKSDSNPPANSQDPLQKVVYTVEDEKILEQLYQELEPYRDEPVAGLVVRAGKLLMGTPYVAHTLETNQEEQLVINLRELDCTTYAENCLALARTSSQGKNSLTHFADELRQIRYRDGVLEGYPSRLHYFCDWIHNNDEKGLIASLGPESGVIPLDKQIGFMSSHPESYRQLAGDSSLVEIMADQEKEISARRMFYIPEARIPEIRNQLKSGDIVGLTTGVEGLAIAHVGILVEQGEELSLMHASSKAMEVVISEGSLEDYLLESKSVSGIMVARPLDSAE